MAEIDPDATQRDLGYVAELAASGFEDVVEIGRGGFGVVFRCLQPRLTRTVAVKLLTSDLEADNRERFLREQQAMGRLSGHPNIVTIHQVGTTDSGCPFIVMPYHSRGSLESWIRRHGPLDWPVVLHLGIRIAGALETAHRLEILHRDVKPGNILLTDYGDEQLGDFGIARISGSFETTSGAITGSPAYTAPEVLEGTPPSVASDIYSLGATLFCAITGHAAFERRSGEKLLTQFLRITKEPVPDLREHYPADVCDVIEKAMARDPGHRFGSAALFGEELRRLQAGHGLSTDALLVPDQPDVGYDRYAASTGTSLVGDDAETSYSPTSPETDHSRVRVFVAEDHPVYREGLIRHWAVSPSIAVIGATGDGDEVVPALERLQPDVAVVDLRLPGEGGLDILERLSGTASTTAVLILTAYVDSATVYRALAAGARGFIEKSASLEEISQAVTTIAAGGTVIAPLVSGALADEIRLRGRGEQPLLTPAESVVLNLAADGLSSQEIAGQLGVTVQTVKARLARICTKFGVADRAGAVARAFRLGLLS